MRVISRSQSIDPRVLAMCVTSIGSFMSILDGTIVNIALPDILRDFDAPLGRGQFVLTAYLLALAIVIPLSGYLAERFGMKRLYLVTLVCFTAGSALCGLAWNLPSLIAFRVLQGLGGGMLQPLGMAMVFTMITPLERGRYMGLLGLPLLVAPMVGPTLGGFLIEYMSWRMIFWINLPIGVLNFILAIKLLPERPPRPGLPLDKLGLVLAAIGLPSLLFALGDGEGAGWTSPLVVACLVGGAAAVTALIVVERRRPHALLQVRLFGQRDFALAVAVLFTTQFTLFGMQFLFPIYLQSARGLSAAETGLVLLPSGAVTFAALTLGGRAYNRLGPRTLAVPGMLTLLASALLLARTDENTGLVYFAVLACTRGVGIGLCTSPLQTAAYNTVAVAAVPRATATIQTMFRIFASLSTAALAGILAVSLGWHGGPPGASVTDHGLPAHLLARSFQDAYLLLAVVVVGGLAMALFVRDRALAVEVRSAGDGPQAHEQAFAGGE